MDNKNMIENIYPLSPMQEGMLLYSVLEGNKHERTYFEQQVFRISGILHTDLFEESINKLIERYEVLRTLFIHNDIKRPLQVVLKKNRVKIHFEDISHLSGDDRTEYIRAFKENEIEKGFDLTKKVPLRFSIIKLKEDEFIYIQSYHHILFDGWSSAIFLKELFQIYYSLKNNIRLELPQVNGYSKYIKWLGSQDKKEAILYWKNYLEGYEQQTCVPKISSVADENIYINKSVQFVISKEITNKLQCIAKNNNVTVNTIFQTVWGILLQRYNNVDDAVFGAVVSGRPAEIIGIENMVGLFINTVPVRVKSDGNKQFIEMVKEVQDSAIESKKYEYAQLAEIQSNTLLKQKLIDNIMIFENYPISQQQDSNSIDLKVKPEDGIEQTNYNFNICICMTDEIIVRLNYNESIYDEQYVKRISTHIEQMLKVVAETPEKKVSVIDILSKEEKRRLLVDFNNTKVMYAKEKTIHELFEEQVEKTPDKIAIVYEEKELTYKELNIRANQLARLLREKGVGPDKIVGIMVERSIEMLVGIMGILKAGGAYLPIDPEYPQDRIEYMLEDSYAGILLTQTQLIGKIKFDGSIIEIDSEELYIGDGKNLKKINTSNNLAYVIYTSGSTGKPKGVMLEHRNAVNFIIGINNTIAMKDTDNILALTTISFDIFFLETVLSLTRGLKVVIVNSKLQKDADALSEFILENNINVIQTTPSRIKLLESSSKGLSCLAKIDKLLIGGEALPQSLFEEFKKLKLNKVYNMYGPTETTVWSAIKDLSDSINVNIGNPMSNQRIYIVDKNNNLQPVGVAGELCISGDGLARGYLNKPELTQEKFTANPYEQGERMYRTGDLARWLPDGNIEFMGRIDHQVKIRGFRIELGEIESQLLKYEEIKEAVVIDREDKDGNKFLCAYLVSDREMTVTELREQLSKELPDYMVPTYFMQLEKIPLTPNGKINRKALPEPDKSLTAGNEYVPPENEVQQIIEDIWAKVLELEVVGVTSNFYELGGHSLKAVAISNMCKKVGIDIPVDAIARYGTIKNICKNLTLESKLPIIENDCIKEDADQIITIDENEYTVYDKTQDYFWCSNFTRVKLKIKDQIGVTSYSHYAYPLSVLLAYNVYKPWYYQHFTQLCAKAYDDSVFVSYQEPDDFYINVMDSSNISYKQIDEIDDIVTFIIKNIANGRYVNVDMDYCLTNILIYGYDILEKRFLATGFNDSFEATYIVIDFEDVKADFEKSAKKYQNNGSCENKVILKMFSVRNINNYRFDIDNFICEINNYLGSFGNIDKVCVQNNKNLVSNEFINEDIVFGLAATKFIVENLKKFESNEMPIDYRSIHLLAEHKQGMFERLQFINSYFSEDTSISSYIKGYTEIVNDFKEIYMLYLQIQSTKEDSDRKECYEKIIKTMELSIEKESAILTNIYSLYHKEKMNYKPQIVSKNDTGIYEYGKCIRKELKMKLQKQVNSYLYRACPISIILCYDYISWLNSHMVQICAQVYGDGYTAIDYQEEYFFYKDVLEFSHKGYKQLSSIENIVNYAIERLDEGNYLNIFIDEYYIKTKSTYMKQHFVHETFIYGYDNQKNCFMGMGFDNNGLFNTYYIEYEIFLKAFESAKVHYKESAPFAEESALLCYYPRKHPNYIFYGEALNNELRSYVDGFLNELNCYIKSWGNSDRVSIIYHDSTFSKSNMKYGIDAVRFTLDRLKKSMEGQLLIDYRSIHLLAEHKRGILSRLEFAAKHKDKEGATKELIERYKEIVKDYELIRVKFFEFLSTKVETIRKNNIQLIIEVLEVAIEKEKEILTNIYNYYRGQNN